jgi:hypothetical protein
MADPNEAIAFSNGIRLSGRQWLGMALFAILLVVFAPRVWVQLEDFTPPADYRIPHELSNDYWLYERYAALAAERYDTLLIGDSVIWGEYVKRQQTLAYYLNREAGKERCANLGLDGAHPLALCGLIRHYAGGVGNRNVLLECNPLWLSSPTADLQDDKKVNQFNHPRLVPQFSPHIPSYKEEISPRLGVLLEQRVTFRKWTNHLQEAYYQQNDLPSWTLEHPYASPLEPLTRGLPPSGNELRHLQQPWYQSGITKQDYPWVDLETSLQWHAFQEVIELLRARGNRVFVVVGPFNEHMLTAASRERYDKVKRTIAAWLDEKQIPYKMPAPLASEQYADASHPLPQGYATLARQLCDELFFRSADLRKTASEHAHLLVRQ